MSVETLTPYAPFISLDKAIGNIENSVEKEENKISTLSEFALAFRDDAKQRIFSLPGGIASPWGVKAILEGVKEQIKNGSQEIQIVAMFHGTVGNNPDVYSPDLEQWKTYRIMDEIDLHSKVDEFHNHPNYSSFGDTGFTQIAERCCGAGAEDEYTTRRQVVHSLEDLIPALEQIKLEGITVHLTVIEALAALDGSYKFRLFGDTHGMNTQLRQKVNTLGKDYSNIESQGDNPYYKEIAAVGYPVEKLASFEELDNWFSFMKASDRSVVGVACSDPRQGLLIQSNKGINPDLIPDDTLGQIKDRLSIWRRWYKSSKNVLPEAVRDWIFGSETNYEEALFSDKLVNDGHREPAALIVTNDKTAKIGKALALHPLIIAKRKYLGQKIAVAQALPFLINIPRDWWNNPEYADFFKGLENLLSVLNKKEFEKGRIGKGRRMFLEDDGNIYNVTKKGKKWRIRGLPIVCSRQMKTTVEKLINPGIAYNIKSVGDNSLGTPRAEKTFGVIYARQFSTRTSGDFDDPFGELQERDDILDPDIVVVQVPNKTKLSSARYSKIKTNIALRKKQIVVV